MHARALAAVLCVLGAVPTLCAAKPEPLSTDRPQLVVQLDKAPEEDYTRQINPAVRLARQFPAAQQISLAVAVVPDPLVPRYRRLYDLALVAIELGMQRNGYVLDRFYLPWNAKLRETEGSKGPAGASEGSQDGASEMSDPLQHDISDPELPFTRGSYGLLLFRCDAWRYGSGGDRPPVDDHGRDAGSPAQTGECADSPGGTRLRALYIVTDTSTKGVESRALRCATDRIASQLSSPPTGNGERTRLEPNCWRWKGEPESQPPELGFMTPAPKVGLMTYPLACAELPPASTLLVLGPSFSGSIGSVRALSSRLGHKPGDITGICLVSSSASDDTNAEASTPQRLAYAQLSLANRYKILHVARLTLALRGVTEPPEVPDRVAILAEASTFGNGVCNKVNVQFDTDHDKRLYDEFCRDATFLYFPANIADIRYGLHRQRDLQRRESGLTLPATSEHLSLELGAENGSEYPESRQSGVTSVSAEIAVEQVLDSLKAMNPPPQIVIVVATDVRDRLFLFDELRERLPRALLIDLEADNLLGHPDFLHASRGAVAMASTNLSTAVPEKENEGLGHSRLSPISAWSSDIQTILARAVACMTDTEPAHPDPRCLRWSSSGHIAQAAIQVVTLEGFKPVSKAYDPEEASPPEVEATRPEDAATRRDAPTVEEVSIGTALLGESSPKSLPSRSSTATEELTARWDFNLAKDYAPVLCLAAAWLWMYPLVIAGGGTTRLRESPPRRRPRRRRQRERSLKARVVNLLSSVAYVVCFAYGALLLYVANDIHQEDYDNSILVWMFVALAGTYLGLFICLLVLRRATRAATPLTRRNFLAPASFALAAIVMSATPLLWLQTARSSFGRTLDLDKLVRLGLDPDPGLAFLLLVALATLALLYASVVLATAAAIVNRNSAVLRNALPGPAKRSAVSNDSADDPADGRDGFQTVRRWLNRLNAWWVERLDRWDLRLVHRRGLREINPYHLLIVTVVLIGLLVGPDLIWHNLRLTIFGQFASEVALLAITATTASAAVLACSAIGAARRISSMSEYMLAVRRGASGCPGPGLWSPDESGPRAFPATPVLATAGYGGYLAKRLREANEPAEWTRLLRDWLYGWCDESKHRVAVFTLLATEISLYRWSVAGAVLCTLASVGAVYLFPIEADRLLLLNLLILVAMGVATAYVATAFERDKLLCHVLCNRKEGRHFSAPLFACIAIPFVIFALAIAIANIPGVVDWGGGLLQLLKSLGVHG